MQDDYSHDGRLLGGDLAGYAIPSAVKKNLAVFNQLADAYKQLNAPFGTFAMNTLKASTTALASDTNKDNRYTTLEKSIAQVTDQRDEVVDGIKALLGAAESGTSINHAQATALLDRAQGLLGRAAGLANH